MRILVTGSSGLVGSALVAALEADGVEVVRLLRRTPTLGERAVRWQPAEGSIDTEGLEGLDGVVHLAGEGIAERRWSAAQKARIRNSRVDGTTLLARTLARLDQPPPVLVSASAIGFYGDGGEDLLTEHTSGGHDFLADVVRAWEDAARPAAEAGIRVVHPRTGIVLSADGGALGTQLLPFRLGLGGRIGDGRQWMSWISIDDEVGALRWLLERELEGPVNLTSPNPVRNTDYTAALGRVLGRPTFLPTPKAALWVRLGRELTESLLYVSQRVVPTKLTSSGFSFRHPELEPALRAVLDEPAGG